MRVVHGGPLTVLPGVALLLAVLAATVGLGPAALATGAVLTVVLWALLERGLRRDDLARLGPANTVTLVRAGLAVAITTLVVQSWNAEVPRALVVALSCVALSLDLVDGRLARARGSVTALGAAFDMETDAFLILVLSVYVVPLAGAWVLLIGLARYLLFVAAAVWPWLGGPVPPRPWAKVVAAVQGVVLVVVAADLLPAAASRLLLAVSLLLLAESFGRQVVVLWRLRHEQRTPRSPLVRPLLDGLALVVVWLALVLPHRPEELSGAALVAVPVELLAFVALALVLPPLWGRVLGAVAGVLLMLTVVVSLLDLGFYEAFDRPFNPMTDPGYLGSGLDFLHSSLGRTGQLVVTGGALLTVVVVALLCVWAVLRIRRVVRAAPRAWARVVVALTLVWAVAGVGGARVDGVPVAGSQATSLVAGQVDEVRAEIRDRAVFERALAHDPYQYTPGADLLTRLRGKDVLVVFVESYGRVAVENSWFAPLVDGTLSHATTSLGRAGFHARSGWMGSPTFGGLSWLAHSTLQSGLWIDSQQRYDQVLPTDRLTLASAFKRAGWRTVGDIPSDEGPWPQGQRFYGYSRIYNSSDVGYAGPKFSYARVPDEFTYQAFAQRELQPTHRRPVMAEIDLDSSHAPWIPLPHLAPWDALGDGALYAGMLKRGHSWVGRFGDTHTQQAHYAESIRYSLRSLVTFVRHTHDKNLVMVVLGDHQPHAVISGNGGSHDVPVSVIAHDPAVLRAISGWGWTPGLQPDSSVPTLPMDQFRDRFLSAYGSRPGR